MEKLVPEDLTFAEVGHLPIIKDFAKKIQLVETLDAMVDSEKDKRPDLKQFLISMLCVERNIPILGTCEDGNASDKTLNNELLGGVSRHMARHGLKPQAFVYVADSAFVTPDNLNIAKDKNVKFLTRLPATYKECSRAINDAVFADNWIDLGKLNQTPATNKRPAAYYRGFETTVELYGETYRAIVVHSSAHDKRRHKRIDRLLGQKRKDLEAHCKKINAGPFYCRADAEAAAKKIVKTAANSYHRLHYDINEVAKYRRGRPAKGKPRTPIGYEYHLDVEIAVDADAVAPLRLEAGCFELLSNLSSKPERVHWSVATLLELYKNQSGIEQNFGFLKDPVIVNSIFLKKPSRIEVLGFVLLIALLIWRLMERCMRQYLERTKSKITGWKNRPTNRPTSFMMTTKFLSILVARSGNRRQLVKPFKPVQLEFIQALGVNPKVFIYP